MTKMTYLNAFYLCFRPVLLPDFCVLMTDGEIECPADDKISDLDYIDLLILVKILKTRRTSGDEQNGLSTRQLKTLYILFTVSVAVPNPTP